MKKKKIGQLSLEEFLDFWLSSIIKEESMGIRIGYAKALKFAVMEILKSKTK